MYMSLIHYTISTYDNFHPLLIFPFDRYVDNFSRNSFRRNPNERRSSAKKSE